jgi:hypothetical protein
MGEPQTPPRVESSSSDRPSLAERLKALVKKIRMFQRGIDHFIPRPEIIPYVWRAD